MGVCAALERCEIWASIVCLVASMVGFVVVVVEAVVVVVVDVVATAAAGFCESRDPETGISYANKMVIGRAAFNAPAPKSIRASAMSAPNQIQLARPRPTARN